MDVNQHQRFIIADRSYLNLVKRDIAKLAESYGFSENEIARINIVVSEIATNLVLHATHGGEILVKPFGTDFKGIEIISIDHGPGMENPERLMEDGVSTNGTAGEGFGAIKRQSSFFEYYTTPELGTILLVRIYKTEPVQQVIPKPAKLEIGSIMVAKTGETICGDSWCFQQVEGNSYFLVLDGLGHGPDANEAAAKGIESFKKCRNVSPAELMRQLHAAIRKTRGAVGTAVLINSAGNAIEFCGIGNIAGKIFSTKGPEVSVLKSLIAYNGILGHNIPHSVHNQNTNWGNSRMLVLHSDGIKSRFELSRYPNLQRLDPTLIAAIIYRDFNRGTDDTTVVVAKSKN